jgi:cobalt-zinc-cadmium efflux system outer membrane protein
MKYLHSFRPLCVLLVLAALPDRAIAQIVVIDDLILMTSRQQQKQAEARTHRHLDPPGGEFLMPPSPGADEPRLGEERRFPLPLPFSLARRGKRRFRRIGEGRLKIGAEPSWPSTESYLVGPLEVPAEDDGPANALSLNAAIERLLAVNADLAAQFQDIPKARADILTAGLRNNPLLFVNVSNIPYGHFSPQRPASTNYDITVIQQVDINGKRGCRIRAAQEAKSVLEAQYQDAVRRKLDRLHDAFVDVLEARQALGALQAGLVRLKAMEETTKLIRARSVSEGRSTLAYASGSDETAQTSADMDAIAVARTDAELAIPRAETALLQSRRALALLLGIPSEQAPAIQITGMLHDCAPPPPGMEELVRIALQTRPDLTAYQLGISRALADLRREKAEAVDDLFVLYTPYTVNDYSPLGKQSASGWGMGVVVSLPFFDRNQGEIARARVNVTQTQMEQQGLVRRIVNEVQYAATEYAVSREAVDQYERSILADARALRDEQDRLFANGQASLDSWLEAQREYDEVVREYLEALVYHRRTMLRLNGAVGQRILP